MYKWFKYITRSVSYQLSMTLHKAVICSFRFNFDGLRRIRALMTVLPIELETFLSCYLDLNSAITRSGNSSAGRQRSNCVTIYSMVMSLRSQGLLVVVTSVRGRATIPMYEKSDDHAGNGTEEARSGNTVASWLSRNRGDSPSPPKKSCLSHIRNVLTRSASRIWTRQRRLVICLSRI